MQGAEAYCGGLPHSLLLLLYWSCSMQSVSRTGTTNKPTTSFLQAGFPSRHPTNGIRVLMENCVCMTEEKSFTTTHITLLSLTVYRSPMWRQGSTSVQPVDVFWSYRVTVSARTAGGLLPSLARRPGTLSRVISGIRTYKTCKAPDR